MKLDLNHAKSSLSVLEIAWLLEPLYILGALAFFSVGLKQGVWIAAGLVLLALSFLQRCLVIGRPSQSTTFDVPWALLLGGAIVSLGASYDVLLSLPVLLALTGSIALYYAAANTPRPMVLAQSALLAGVPAAAYFLTQYQYIPPADKNHLASSLGMLMSAPFPRLGSWEPFSNSVATLLEGLIPLGIALTIARRSWAWRAISGAATGLMVLAILVTASRGAWVALLASAVFWLASRQRWGFIVLSGVAIAALVILGTYLSLVEDATLAGIPAVGSVLYQLFARPDRLRVYQGSLRLIQDFPLTGIGLGEVFAMVYSQYVLLIRHAFLTYSHNLYLTVWLGQGLPGILGMGWLVAATASLVIREHEEGCPSPLFQAAWMGAVTLLIHGLFDSRQYVDLWTMWPLFVLLGLAVSNSTSKSTGRATKARSNMRLRQWAWVALGLLVVGSAVTWRPLVAATYANLGAVKQAKAELAADLPQDIRDDYLQAATACYKHALTLARTNRTANLRLGNLAVADGRYEEAIAHLEIAWRTAPEDPTARKALGLAYAWVGEIDQAVELLKDTPEIVGELNTWAWWHNQEGRQQVAKNAYRTSLALKPDQPQVGDRLSALESQ